MNLLELALCVSGSALSGNMNKDDYDKVMDYLIWSNGNKTLEQRNQDYIDVVFREVE